MCRVYSVSNQKGGVGKSAISANLGVGFAKNGLKVAVLDADPQGNLSSSLGVDDIDELDNALGEYFFREIHGGQIDIDNYIIHNNEGVDIIPCNIKLAGLDFDIMKSFGREYLLRSLIDKIRERYDMVLIDCSPSLNMVTVNALAAADSVIIPMEASYLFLKGLDQLLDSIDLVREKLNRSLEIEGIVINKFNPRTNYEPEILERIRTGRGKELKIFETKIPESVRAKECTAHGESIFKYDPKCKVALAYENLTKEVLAHDC